MVRLFSGGVHHFHALKNSWSISRSRCEIKVDINKLTKSTKTLVVRLQVNHLSRDTSCSNYNLHTVCDVSVISNGIFVGN